MDTGSEGQEQNAVAPTTCVSDPGNLVIIPLLKQRIHFVKIFEDRWKRMLL
jgi:hypothetical protein